MTDDIDGANERPIEPGDVVCLKSSGPQMVVRSVQGDDVLTEWFDGNTICQHTFKIFSIERNTDESLVSASYIGYIESEDDKDV
jgi:uncharacterized protein YodC (DUF2158 family)